MVVAPDTEKSAVGHAITIANPIRTVEIEQKNGFCGYAVDGTPADCVKIGVQSLMESQPDIIVSGINMGSNTGVNVIYSGTVSAATEGTLLGIPSIAFSLDSIKKSNFSVSEKIAERITRRILQQSIPGGTLINVNIPDLPESEIKGIRITRQGNAFFRDSFEKREDPRGRMYYWLTGEMEDPKKVADSDSQALAEGFISITPIHYQLTNEEFLSDLKSWDLE